MGYEIQLDDDYEISIQKNNPDEIGLEPDNLDEESKRVDTEIGEHNCLTVKNPEEIDI